MPQESKGNVTHWTRTMAKFSIHSGKNASRDFFRNVQLPVDALSAFGGAG